MKTAAHLLSRTATAAILTCCALPLATLAMAPAQPDERIARGEQVLRDLNRGRTQPVFESMRRDFPFLADATAGYALGDVWGRTVLDARTRQLSAMAAFAALGLRPFFKVHAGYALDAGVPVAELKEIVYLVTVPAGFPRAIEASQALQELLQERGLTVGSAPAATP
ncbi:carboxymuconolactone decarboxylase family protein [Rubrivivax sp. RP6-9]|uniref:carboxymuconolactone decarboxylase family protein n=1 Tax=Rubrivivax sp. RP6-9 TaxID=3415750 RepID=UPI003CC67A93